MGKLKPCFTLVLQAMGAIKEEGVSGSIIPDSSRFCTFDVFKSFQLTQAKEGSYDTVLWKSEENCTPHKKETEPRHAFYQRAQ